VSGSWRENVPIGLLYVPVYILKPIEVLTFFSLWNLFEKKSKSPRLNDNVFRSAVQEEDLFMKNTRITIFRLYFCTSNIFGLKDDEQTPTDAVL